jgi:hypothetical protein
MLVPQESGFTHSERTRQEHPIRGPNYEHERNSLRTATVSRLDPDGYSVLIVHNKYIILN